MGRRHRYSRNASAETPLAIEYRSARLAYLKAGEALRRSCATERRACGFPKAPKGARTRYAFVAKNTKAMLSEFLGAPAPGGTNEDVLRKQLGHLNVRDKTEWEPIAEKYETGPLETFDEAFAALARAAKGGRSKPDWRRFDIAVLRECAGLDSLELPTWVYEAANQQEEGARFYGEVPF